MQARKQDPKVLLDTTRIIILPMDLSDEKLGQTAAIYNLLQSEVTDIIHSAWKMDFNMTIKDFDRECLQGLYYLLKFACASPTRSPMRFHFMSSIGSAGSGLVNEIKEEPLPRHVKIAVAQGYGQAKYAGEHICWAAMDLWGK
jgi:thioester reductase-like protein